MGNLLVATFGIVSRICPLGWNRVEVSENLGTTTVEPVAPVATYLESLDCFCRVLWMEEIYINS